MRFFSKRLKNEFEIAVVYEPSVFKPLKVYCVYDFKVAAIFDQYDCVSVNLLCRLHCFAEYYLCNALTKMSMQ